MLTSSFCDRDNVFIPYRLERVLPESDDNFRLESFDGVEEEWPASTDLLNARIVFSTRITDVDVRAGDIIFTIT